MDNKTRVLLVEDDEFLQRMYATKFEREGLEVITASDGEAAFSVLQKNEVKLALVDIMMPKMDGFEFLKKVRADKKLSSLPVIVLTNLNNEEDIRQAKKLGALEYIVKANFLPSEVLEIMKKHIK